MRRFNVAMFGLLAVPLVLFGIAMLAHKLGDATTYRTDPIGRGVTISVPASWHREPVEGGWVYKTGCEPLGVLAAPSAGTPIQVVASLETQAGLTYAPIEQGPEAWIPALNGTVGILVKQIDAATQVQVLTLKASCPGVTAAIASLHLG